MAAQHNSSSCAPHFNGTDYDNWKRKMSQHIKSRGRKIWGVVENEFVVLDSKNPTPREEELLQLNDQALDILYEVLDDRVFESIKILNKLSKFGQG